jgi:radical SAM superfamily enzyme YgiQ (UPF0313 family)
MSLEKKILLVTLNARYSHCSFGLRYLYANMGPLQGASKIIEFTISQDPREIAEAILAQNPTIVGIGVYIWNARQSFEVVSILKRVSPNVRIVLGGPEVSYETESQQVCRLADLTIQGEADFKFREVCLDFIERGTWPAQKWIAAPQPPIREIVLPYAFYSDSDIRDRVIYVEASRGCPYKCEYCLSSLDKAVRGFDLEQFLTDINRLIERGVRQFKFIDRTFNLSTSVSSRILSFFLERIEIGLFLHFEMVPDRLPQELRELIQRFPKGSLQFEVGIQTWNPEVAKLVSRRQDYTKIRENFSFLSEAGNVHTHADLIVGLPGETLESFAAGFDAVSRLKPDEIQVGLLKRLKGTPIVRHDLEWEMVYQEHPPFQILKTRTMDFQVIQSLGRFSKFWDLVSNSGNFKGTMRILEAQAASRSDRSLFWEFEDLARFLHSRHSQSHGVALLSLTESVWIYLRERAGVDVEFLRRTMIQDYSDLIRRDVPKFLKDANEQPCVTRRSQQGRSATPERQRRHLQGQIETL